MGDLWRLDVLMLEYMTVNCVPNGILSVVAADGRLVYCKAFAWNALLKQAGEPVIAAEVHSLFRVASISKVITALATMAALEDGHFGAAGLSAFAADYVNFRLADGSMPVPELANIRISHLLSHSAGWCEGFAPVSTTGPPIVPTLYSPNFMPEKNDLSFARSARVCTPITKATIQAAMNSVPLTWDPAGPDTYWSYSTHGYAVLASALEAATGVSFESYVQGRIFEPMGTNNSRLGDTEKKKRKLAEVKYYGNGFPAGSTSRNVMSPVCSPYSDGWPLEVEPYAYFNLRNSDGGSAWLCSAYDLALLLRHTFPPTTGTSLILQPATLAEMFASPIRQMAGMRQYYGWDGDRFVAGDYSKTGHFEGTNALILNFGPMSNGGGTDPRRGVGVSYVFNRNSGNASWAAAEASFVARLNTCLAGIARWGSADLFDSL